MYTTCYRKPGDGVINMIFKNKNLFVISLVIGIALTLFLSESDVKSQTLPPQQIDIQESCCTYLKDPNGGGACLSQFCSEFEHENDSHKTGLCVTSVSGMSLE